MWRWRLTATNTTTDTIPLPLPLSLCSFEHLSPELVALHITHMLTIKSRHNSTTTSISISISISTSIRVLNTSGSTYTSTYTCTGVLINPITIHITPYTCLQQEHFKYNNAIIEY